MNIATSSWQLTQAMAEQAPSPGGGSLAGGQHRRLSCHARLFKHSFSKILFGHTKDTIETGKATTDAPKVPPLPLSIKAAALTGIS